jgi:carboxymethylenebutenolidase
MKAMSDSMMIDAGADGSFRAHVAGGSMGARSALLICPEVFGVNRHMRAVADRFASHGFLAVVPDIFWRVEPGLEIPYDQAGLARGSEILAAFDIGQGGKDLGRVVEAVRARPDCNGKVGVIGFCVGGTLAWLGAARFEVQAAVGYYAKGIESFLGEARAIRCPTMLHYAGADRFIPQAIVDKVNRAVEGMPHVEVYTYPGVDHGFNSDDRRAYNADVAGIAMTRTLRLLDEALEPD